MSQRQFDDLTRALVAAGSRRHVLKALVAGLVAALFGGAAAEPALGRPVCAAACGPCQECTYDPIQGTARCITTCSVCERCAPNRVTCLPKCDGCDKCLTTGPKAGQCHSRCQRCEGCDAGRCTSRCGPGRACIDSQCIAV